MPKKVPKGGKKMLTKLKSVSPSKKLKARRKARKGR